VRREVAGVVTLGLSVVVVASAAAATVPVDGHRMYYECTGHGSPTVILDAGSPDTSDAWRWVQPVIAEKTRVCAYDRAGLGRSAPALPGRRTPRTQAQELHGMLAAAKIPGPYVVVGHSWGGLLARLFARDYPRDTAGVVLVDATTFPYLTPATAARLKRKTTREGIDTVAAVAESAAIRTLGSLPLVVLGSNKPPLDAKFLKAQDDEAALSTDSIDAIARNSTHYIQRPQPDGQPQVVIDAIGAVIRAVRGNATLPNCGRLFSAQAVTCR
jgi:pimeloyl-ACP methyl ester carboxylesterase